MTICGNAGMDQNITFFWNRSPLPCPATCNLPVSPTLIQRDILRTARNTLSNCVQCLGQQTHLTTEFSLLNRLVYMRHGQLRREKSYTGLKQVRLCLKRFRQSRLEKVLKDLLSDFESVIIEEGIKVRLPSRQMWEHLLTHFLGAAALLSNTASRCAAVFLHVHRHLTTGNLISLNVVLQTLLSRIWVCCQALSLDMQTWYQTLRPVAGVLEPTEATWLPAGEVLPDDLSTWLREQGFSSGLDKQNGKDAGDGGLAALMAKYYQKQPEAEEDIDEQEDLDNTNNVSQNNSLQDEKIDTWNIVSGEDLGAPVSACDSWNIMADEDLGAPVNVSDVEIASEDEDDSRQKESEKSQKAVSACALPGLKKKIMKASTIRDLQLILKRFKKKFPEMIMVKRCKKCLSILGNLQAQSLLLSEKSQEVRVQKLLAQGKRKVLKFIRESVLRTESVIQTGDSLQKKNNLETASEGETSIVVLNQKEKNVPKKKRKKNKLDTSTAPETQIMNESAEESILKIKKRKQKLETSMSETGAVNQIEKNVSKNKKRKASLVSQQTENETEESVPKKKKRKFETPISEAQAMNQAEQIASERKKKKLQILISKTQPVNETKENMWLSKKLKKKHQKSVSKSQSVNQFEDSEPVKKKKKKTAEGKKQTLNQSVKKKKKQKKRLETSIS